MSVLWRTEPAIVTSISRARQKHLAPRDTPMKHIYDILSIDAKGPTWIGTAMDFESAKTMVLELNKSVPRHYVIFNQMTQEKISFDPIRPPDSA